MIESLIRTDAILWTFDGSSFLVKLKFFHFHRAKVHRKDSKRIKGTQYR